MFSRDFAFAAIIALSLTGCTARTAPSHGQDAPTTGPAVSLPREQGPIESGTGLAAATPSRSCSTDSDCAVKNVGNCCGYFPMCVNKDARTDPAAVRAQCEKDGMASICGFQEVSGCRCVNSQCENLTNGSAVR